MRELGGVLIVDEIYHGLTYGVEAISALMYSSDVFVINSFSKYYGMTGWRLGWVVAPDAYVSALDKLAQNIFSGGEHAGAARGIGGLYRCRCGRSWRKRREVFRGRRDYLLPALRELGFDIPVTPEGAFYLYADASRVLPTTASGLHAICWGRPVWRLHPGLTSAATARAGTCVFPTLPRAREPRSGRAPVGAVSAPRLMPGQSRTTVLRWDGRSRSAMPPRSRSSVALTSAAVCGERSAQHAEKARLGHQHQFPVGMLCAAGVEPRRQRVRELLRDGFRRAVFLAERMPAGAVAVEAASGLVRAQRLVLQPSLGMRYRVHMLEPPCPDHRSRKSARRRDGR